MIVKNSNIFLCIFFIIHSLVSRVFPLAPKLLNVSVTEEGGLYVVWSPLQYNESDPILGYKIKIWEVKEQTSRMFKLINGEQVPGLIREDVSLEVSNKDLPAKKPREFRADRNANSLEIGYIKADVLNEIRVQGYRQNEDGDFSEPWRLKVFKEYGHNEVGHRHMDQCMLTVSNQVRALGGIFPHIYNSYL